MRRELTSVVQSLCEMGAMLPGIRGQEKNPGVFWQDNFEPISARMKTIYSDKNNPDVEILVPVHHNADDLPLLFYGLSKQKIEPDQRVGLTVVMHNNQDRPEWKMNDDGSWKIIEALSIVQVPIKILELTDPLLTGPYMSWQYLIAQSTGQKIAVLDADCLPPSYWLSRITQPLFENGDKKFSGGVRVDMNGIFPYNITTRVNCVGMMIRNIVNPDEPNLPRIDRFQGGQAAYDGTMARLLMKDLIGTPGGDGKFAKEMLRRYGEGCFAFANAPVFCKMTNPDQITLETLIRKIQRTAQLYLPNGVVVRPPGDNDRDLHYIYLYSPWFRSIVDAYFVESSLTMERATVVFTQTALEQGFSKNPHVVQFVEKIQNFRGDGIGNVNQLVDFHRQILVNCHRPTLTDLIKA